jgi:hypothetical protein
MTTTSVYIPSFTLVYENRQKKYDVSVVDLRGGNVRWKKLQPFPFSDGQFMLSCSSFDEMGIVLDIIEDWRACAVIAAGLARSDELMRPFLQLSVPEDLENLHTCENGCPGEIMSTWRVGGIVHARENRTNHEYEYH